MIKVIVCLTNNDIKLSKEFQEISFKYDFRWCIGKTINIQLEEKYLVFVNYGSDYKKIYHNFSSHNNDEIIHFQCGFFHINSDEVIIIKTPYDFEFILKHGHVKPSYNDKKIFNYD